MGLSSHGVLLVDSSHFGATYTYIQPSVTQPQTTMASRATIAAPISQVMPTWTESLTQQQHQPAGIPRDHPCSGLVPTS